MKGTLSVNKDIVRFCKHSLKDILYNVTSSHSAILATEDGNLVAYRTLKDSIDADAIAAMSSTAINIADVLGSVGAEDAGNASHNVISESSFNKFALVHAGDLILCLLGDRSMNIGRALQICKRDGETIGVAYKKLSLDSSR